MAVDLVRKSERIASMENIFVMGPCYLGGMGSICEIFHSVVLGFPNNVQSQTVIHGTADTVGMVR